MSNWYRHRNHSDFFNQFYCDRFGPEYGSRDVSYINMSQWDAVKGISIEYYPCGYLSIDIQFGAKINRKIRQAIIKWIRLQHESAGIEFIEQNYDPCYLFVEYRILLLTTDTISQLPQLLRFINLQLREEIFSGEILTEIESITACSLEMREYGKPVHSEYNHKIPQLPCFTDCTNPNRIQSKELSELLSINYEKGELSETDFEKFLSLLAIGEDPDQCHPYNARQPLIFAMNYKNTEIYQLLLHYRASPFSRLDGQNHSSLDLALISGNLVIANIIMEKFSPPQRPVKLMIKNLAVAYHQQKQMIETSMQWYRANDSKMKTVATVVTEVKRTVDESEEREIIAWSNDNFELRDDPQQLRLTESVRRDLHKKNQVIEIIRSQGSMIGFNIFEIIIPEVGNKIYWYVNLSLINSEFRHTDMIPMLVNRHALTLGLLNKDKVVVIVYLAADINSYRLADSLHWPMYQDENKAREAIWIHQALCLRPDETYHHRGLASYVTNQIIVKKRTAAPKQNFQLRFFTRYLLNQDNTLNTDYKAVLVYYYATDILFLSLQRNCNRIHMNLGMHLQSLSYMLQAFLPDFSSQMACQTPAINSSYPKARELFWLNHLIQSVKVISHASFKIRSKL